MQSGNSIIKELESDNEVPAYLRTALISEVDAIRDSMYLVTHFTEYILGTLITCLSPVDNEPNP